MNRRCVFLGDEVLTVQCADLARSAGLEVVAVVSSHPYATTWGEENAVPILDSGVGLVDALHGFDFDVLLSVAHLRLIPDPILAMADVAVNFHDGPLPGYAGLNTPNWAIINGETEHAITWHLIDSGVDTGDIVLSTSFPIEPTDTAFSLNARCYEKALETFPTVVDALRDDRLRPERQTSAGRRVFLRHERPAASSVIDPNRPAADIARLARALDVGPQRRQHLGALRLLVDDDVYVVEGCRPEPSRGGAVGAVTAADELRITTIDGDLVVTTLADVNGRLITPVQLAAVGLDGTNLTAPRPELLERFEETDERISRSEDRAATRLADTRPTAFPASAPTDAPETSETGATSPDVFATVNVPDGCDPDTAIAAIATWLARRNSGHESTFELVTPALAPDLEDLAPLANPPAATVVLSEAATLQDVAAAVAAERERVDSEGVWLGDLVARDPVLRAISPERPEVRVTVSDGREENGATRPGRRGPTTAEFRVGPAEIILACSSQSVSRGDAERFADEIGGLLTAALESPDTPVGRLPMVSAADLAVLRSLNDTYAPHDESMTIDQCFRDRVAAHPEATAVSFGSEQLTYAQLGERVDRFVEVLQAAGAGAGSRVGIALPRGIDMLVTALATLDGGGAYVPLDPEYPDDRLAFMVADADLTVVVGSGEQLPWLAPGSVPVITPRAPSQISNGPSDDRSHDGSDLAYVIYTSGSTGNPKGVMLEHRQVTNFFLAMDEVIGPEPGVWLAVTSLSFDISVLELLWTLTRGFHVVLKPDAASLGLEGRAAPPRRGSPTFSLFHFAASEANNADGYRLLLRGAAMADENGFEAVWIPERHFHEFGGIYPNPAVLGAAVAATTTNVQIRAGSCVLPLHHPARVAEEWAVVDNLSGGRVGIAAAAGWQPNDFVLRPENYADSKAAMLESLEVITRLWRGEEVSMEGPSGPVPIRTLPRPIQPDLPVWITSAGNVETFEIAGRHGHRLLTHLLGQSIDQLTEKIDAYRAAWREGGHEGDGHVTLMLHTYLHDDGDVARSRARPHLREYLRSATGLLKDVASSFPTLRGAGDDADALFASLGDDEMDALLDAAVDRYVGTSGLFGDVDDAMTMVERVTAAGADEVACLVDFGVGTDDVIASLPLLARLKERSYEQLGTPGTTPRPDDGEDRIAADESAAELIRRHGCTHLQCTPSLATMLVADPGDRDALGSIGHMLVGGEALPTALAAELRGLLPGRLTNMYGPTETTIWSLVHEIDAVGDGAVPIGRPIANTTIAILDELGEQLPAGGYGELHIGGAGVARGYHDQPELTADRFVERDGSGRMYATGDVVRLLPDGVVEFGGRTDFQVKVRGHRIELGEIEALLDRHPTVTRAVVTAPQTEAGVRLIAYVLPPGNTPVDTDVLRTYLGELLPEVMLPEAWVVVEQLPLTPNGKIDRRALPDPVDHVVTAPVTAPAADDRERTVAAVWEESLGRAVGRDDNFFDVGGHSLLAVKVFRVLVERTGLDLSLTDVFRFPTVRTFAEHIAALESGDDSGASDGPRPVDAAVTGADRGALRRRARNRKGATG